LLNRVEVVLAVAISILSISIPDARATTDRDRDAVDPFAATPAERAITGGVVTLRSPGSRMLKLVKSNFTMGSSSEEVLEAVADCAREPLGARCKEEVFSDEEPNHKVTLSAFWLDRMEVTVRDYERCVKLKKCKAVSFSQGAKRFDKPSYPMTFVRWRDARNYCRFRGGRLPSEAEFERAARGVTGRRYPWGSFWNSRRANHGRLGIDRTDAGDGHAELAPVGSYSSGRTPDGFLDLAGNVAEWVEDRYAPRYPDGAAVNPRGPALGTGNTSSARVARGGSYEDASPFLRGAARMGVEPDTQAPSIGFRCARSAR
jgi:formylglycine-generating enzyme required for sulfatase activity